MSSSASEAGTVAAHGSVAGRSARGGAVPGGEGVAAGSLSRNRQGEGDAVWAHSPSQTPQRSRGRRPSPRSSRSPQARQRQRLRPANGRAQARGVRGQYQGRRAGMQTAGEVLGVWLGARARPLRHDESRPRNTELTANDREPEAAADANSLQPVHPAARERQGGMEATPSSRPCAAGPWETRRPRRGAGHTAAQLWSTHP